MMKRRTLKNNSNAVVSVVLALLLLGLLAITLTTIQTVYVPRWVEQQEGLHMYKVAGQFADIKHAIDIQSVSQEKTTISTPITLGSEYQSFFTTSRSYGSIHINANTFRFTIENSTYQLSLSLDTLSYSSKNNYYVDQSYVLENGAVIINQSEGNILTSDPSFVSNDQGFDFTYTFFNISERGGKSNIGGYGTYLIQTNYSSSRSYNLTDVTTIQIKTKYPTCWSDFFNDTFKNSGLVYNSDYSMITTDGYVDITIMSGADLDIAIDLVKIFAQISPGRIG